MAPPCVSRTPVGVGEKKEEAIKKFMPILKDRDWLQIQLRQLWGMSAEKKWVLWEGIKAAGQEIVAPRCYVCKKSERKESPRPLKHKKLVTAGQKGGNEKNAGVRTPT